MAVLISEMVLEDPPPEPEYEGEEEGRDGGRGR
jgi:hypothetical protein